VEVTENEYVPAAQLRHTEAPTFAWNVPARQLEQTAFPAVANCPGGHDEHTVAPGTEYLPDAHLVHAAAPLLAWKVPAVQVRQVAAPANADEPGAQGAQTDDAVAPVPAEYMPDAQFRQLRAR